MDLPATLLHLQARRLLTKFDSQELVDWAVAALVAGHDTEHLVMLAGMDRYPSPELWDYFYRSLGELGLSFPPADGEALLAYAVYLAKAVTTGRAHWRTGLLEMGKICAISEYDPRYTDFFALQDHLQSLEAGYDNYLVPELTIENAPEMVREAFAQFLAGHALG